MWPGSQSKIPNYKNVDISFNDVTTGGHIIGDY
jgi:hypothetical protein